MSRKSIEIFLSYSGKDSFEASLLQFALEHLLTDLGVKVWTYERDQAKSERQIGKSLKLRVQNSAVAIFLASPSTFNSGAAQWMELAYADAFDVPFSCFSTNSRSKISKPWKRVCHRCSWRDSAIHLWNGRP